MCILCETNYYADVHISKMLLDGCFMNMRLKRFPLVQYHHEVREFFYIDFKGVYTLKRTLLKLLTFKTILIYTCYYQIHVLSRPLAIYLRLKGWDGSLLIKPYRIMVSGINLILPGGTAHQSKIGAGKIVSNFTYEFQAIRESFLRRYICPCMTQIRLSF